MGNEKRVQATVRNITKNNGAFTLDGNSIPSDHELVVFQLSKDNLGEFNKLQLANGQLVELVIDKINRDNRRRQWNFWGTFGGAILAVLSIVIAFLKERFQEWVGPAIVIAWILFPPVFFWIDWLLCKFEDNDRKLDKIKHNHDLARNIWLGLIAVLVALFEIQWSSPPNPPSSPGG